MTANKARVVHFLKNAPPVDYKNIDLLKRYISENGKIIPQNLHQFRWCSKRLSKEIKKLKF